MKVYINSTSPHWPDINPKTMEKRSEELKKCGAQAKSLIDYVVDYLVNIEKRRVQTDVFPGYLKQITKSTAPQKGEKPEEVLREFDAKIMKGINHTQHTQYYAHLPMSSSFPSIMANFLSNVISCPANSWTASPACTELEVLVMNWLGKLIGLPNTFLSEGKESMGGGIIQPSTTDCILITMLAARERAFKLLKQKNANINSEALLPRLVAYCSKEANDKLKKVSKILMIRVKSLNVDDKGRLRGKTLQKAMSEDKVNCLIPFYVCAKLGTNSINAFDNLSEIAAVTTTEPTVWLHVNAEYAGNGFIVPELQSYLVGIENAKSFNMSPCHWLLVNADCACLWVKNKLDIISALAADDILARNDGVVNFAQWQVANTREFRALKLWFVLKCFGIATLQGQVRNHIQLAQYLGNLIKFDKRLQLINEVTTGVVSFRINGDNAINQRLLATINQSGEAHLTPTTHNNQFILRMTISHQFASKYTVDIGWKIIQKHLNAMLRPADIADEAVEDQERSSSTPVPVATSADEVPEDEAASLTRTKLRTSKKVKAPLEIDPRYSFVRNVPKHVLEQMETKGITRDSSNFVLIASEEEVNLETTDVLKTAEKLDTLLFGKM